MNINEIINTIDNSLENKIKQHKDSIIDNFLKELKSTLKEKNEYVIDRFEENFVVCENQSTGKMINIPKEKINSILKEGDVVIEENEIYNCNNKLREKKEEDIEERMRKIKKIPNL